MSTRIHKSYLALTSATAAAHPALQELERLHQNYTAVQDALKPLKQRETALRAEMGEIIAEVGTVEIPEQTRFEITAPAIVVRYDVAGLDKLVEMLREDGFPEIADAITEHRREDVRAGSFRIASIKPTTQESAQAA